MNTNASVPAPVFATAPKKGFRWWMIIVVLAVVAAVIAVRSATRSEDPAEVVTPVPYEEAPTVEPPVAAEAAPAPATPEAPTPSAGPGCALLGTPPVGSVCFPREADEDGGAIPYRLPVSEGGYTLVALGAGMFNGQPLTPVSAEIGHIVVISGTLPDGSTPLDLNQGVTLTDYVPGAVAVTHIVTPDTPVLVAGAEHAQAMSSSPNCGAEGCNAAYLWSWDWRTSLLVLIEVFDLTTSK